MDQLTHIGLDVHKDTIAVAVLRPGTVEVDERVIANTPEAIRRLLRRHADPAAVRICYEAGPTGYDTHRLIASLGVALRRHRALADPPPKRRARQDRPHRRAQPRAAASGRRAVLRARAHLCRGGGTRPHPRARGGQGRPADRPPEDPQLPSALRQALPGSRTTGGLAASRCGPARSPSTSRARPRRSSTCSAPTSCATPSSPRSAGASRSSRRPSPSRVPWRCCARCAASTRSPP